MWKVVVPLVIVVAAITTYLMLAGRPTALLDGVSSATGTAWTLATYPDATREDGVCLRLAAPDAGATFDWCTDPSPPMDAALTTVPELGPAVVGFTTAPAISSSVEGELLVSAPLDETGALRAFVHLPTDEVDEVVLTAGRQAFRVHR